MRWNEEGVRLAISGAARTAPTPLFLGFLGALALAALASFRGGFGLVAMADFLLLASVVTASTLVAFAGVMVWAARAGQRAEVLAAHRPGSLVLRAGRAYGLRPAMHRVRPDAGYLPLGLTLLADESGFEFWCGSPEHPLRLGRITWEDVAEVRVTRVSRWGRAGGGITVVASATAERAAVELPFAVTGAGLGGLFAPPGAELERVAAALRSRHAAAPRP